MTLEELLMLEREPELESDPPTYEPGSILMRLASNATPPVQQRAARGQRGAAGANTPAGSIEEMVKRMAARKYGWKGDEWKALHELVSRESSWNPNADNPTSSAYGLFQFLDSTRANYGIGLNAGPKKQTRAGLKYILDRYGSPTKAIAHHDRMNWY